MKNIRKTSLLILLCFLFSPISLVLADAAPPREPPGSSILPAGQTMVQMVAESVVIVVSDSVNVEAVFALRNQGGAEESMNVRFPMEPPDGSGDGWGEHPQVSEFEAFVDGRALPINYVTEPLEDGDPIVWATFPVTFPPGENVRVTVSYSTAIGQSNWWMDQAMVEYILQTGAGWYGPIESAVITLRLPYAASESNVYITVPWEPTKGKQPVFVGREVRWEWSNLEPTREDDLRVVFVFPEQWQKVLALEALTGENPADVEAALQLAEAYRELGTERHGGAVSEPLYRLAKQAVQMALVYNPDSPRLNAERLVLELWWCNMGNPACSADYMRSLMQSYETMLAEQPDNPQLTSMTDTIEGMQSWLEYAQQQSYVEPTFEPTPAPTEASSLKPTQTNRPTNTPVGVEKTVIAPTQVPDAPVVREANLAMPFGMGVVVGGIVGVIVMVGVFGLVRVLKR